MNERLLITEYQLRAVVATRRREAGWQSTSVGLLGPAVVLAFQALTTPWWLLAVAWLLGLSWIARGKAVKARREREEVMAEVKTQLAP